ncbi:MAG: lipoyl(octanoyl) transferase LipB [Aigarchaeota archaeon]|nr:lipoyl(octanoyl) transferase LipB [Aigarchaeota archaeon]MCS7127100.1 lipoyl(octanoyl) transferase LipB [Candidatus Calditenuaceae archaeon]MCX8203763.1 lipoyl(octanoyl) transferase LipB [Nitrososphaeria archaeon]MDW8043224.1 lipoyl(octanoyl) transferase LipB [Nitrososphaerota archaeon]
MREAKRLLFFCDLGRTSYDDCHRLMLGLVGLRARGCVGDVVLITEHEHVYTLGRHARPDQVFNDAVPVRTVERAGGPTYHGPGQLVAYPVIRLADWGLGPADLVRALEASVVSVLGELGIRSEPGSPSGRPGVWVDGRKIASIGMAVRDGVSFHGVALNVSADLSMFRGISPCGMSPDVMTSVERELGKRVGLEAVKPLFVREFSALLGAEPLAAQRRELESGAVWTLLAVSRSHEGPRRVPALDDRRER